jgi:hypothetical protein
LLLPLLSGNAQERYFYKAGFFGSDATYNPLSVVLNGGYGIIQLEGQSRDFLHFDYRGGARNVWRNLSHPFGAISRYGWGRFLAHEIFPLSLSRKGAQWLPNYQLHLIGGGMTYRAIYEWFAYYDFPAPRMLSIITIAGYHYLNEVIENHGYQGDNVDPIADIYIFDVGSVVLFSFDGVNRFFSEKLNMADWSLMPSIKATGMSLQNNGQNFVIKWKLPLAEKWYLFHYFGLVNLTGATYKLARGSSISCGIGARARMLQMVDETRHQQTVKLAWNAGLFYDRDNSLLLSLIVSGSVNRGVNLNVYPGFLPLGRFSPGVWAVIGDKGKNVFGITYVWPPGIAF